MIGERNNQLVSPSCVERTTYRSSIGRYIDRQSTDMSVDMSTDISVEGFVNYT